MWPARWRGSEAVRQKISPKTEAAIRRARAQGGVLVIAREVGWALGPFSDSCVPVSLAPARRMALIKVGG